MPHIQKQQTNTACKNSKRKSKKKPQGSTIPVNCEQEKDPVGAAAETKPIANIILLENLMKDFQVSRNFSMSIVSRKAAGSNWEAVVKSNQQIKQKAIDQENIAVRDEENSHAPLSKSARLRQKRRAAEQKYVAIDCEMVGVGINGQEDMLARVSIVSKRGEVLLDKFVKPQQSVTDYRTKVSGIRPHDINKGEDFKSVQNEVVQMLQGKILVGHAIINDLAVLHIKHPKSCIRDTSRYKPLCQMVANGHTPSLKRLTQAILGKEIQTGEHNSVEDARAAMSIYNLLAKDWEAYIRRRQQNAGK